MPSIWKRAMVYLGLADDEDYADYAEYDDDTRGAAAIPPAQRVGYAAPRSVGQPAEPLVRALPREESLSQPEPVPFQSSAVRTLPAPTARLHVVSPSDFNEGAKEVGDRFKARAPVIMNLSLIDPVVAKRLLDFASGLAYGLGGRMQKVSQGVFLLTPQGIEVSAEEKRRLRETGLLFDGDDG